MGFTVFIFKLEFYHVFKMYGCLQRSRLKQTGREKVKIHQRIIITHPRGIKKGKVIIVADNQNLIAAVACNSVDQFSIF